MYLFPVSLFTYIPTPNLPIPNLPTPIIIVFMQLTPQDWHARFTQQARWTQDLRDYLYQQVEIEKARRVLEVGCGTGAVLADLASTAPFRVGLDINSELLQLATRNITRAELSQGDGYALPYRDGCFDITLCHFLLLWLDNPIQVLREMVRVARPGGAVLAMAEPDYGGRIDHPEELATLGQWQTESLQQQGADPLMGRKLAGLFSELGLEAVETGALGGQWSGTPDWEAWASEWAVLESDLREKPSFSEKLGFLKSFDKSAYEQGERVLFVPTFYAWGVVPKPFT
jgi:ubiquinone/menaquinone biosynthesis C-methylase UbiE